MTENIKDSQRMELICEFIKTGKQPEGFKITETKNGKYRLSRIKSERESLEAKRKRLEKDIERIDNELKKFDEQEQEPKQEEKPNEEAQ